MVIYQKLISRKKKCVEKKNAFERIFFYGSIFGNFESYILPIEYPPNHENYHDDCPLFEYCDYPDNGNQLYNVVEFVCCTEYNIGTELTYVVRPFLSDFEKYANCPVFEFCGEIEFDSNVRTCCSQGSSNAHLAPVGGLCPNLLSCGNLQYDSTLHTCCFGDALSYLMPIGSICPVFDFCGEQQFNVADKICCTGITALSVIEHFLMPLGTVCPVLEYCGDQLFDSSERECCFQSSSIAHLAPVGDLCPVFENCGSIVYDSTKQMCCESTPGMSIEAFVMAIGSTCPIFELCGTITYDIAEHICCEVETEFDNKLIVPIGEFCPVFAQCGEIQYDIDSEICCQDAIISGVSVGSYLLGFDETCPPVQVIEYCGDIEYNMALQMCCFENQPLQTGAFLLPFDIAGTSSCPVFEHCDGIMYDIAEQMCCDAGIPRVSHLTRFRVFWKVTS